LWRRRFRLRPGLRRDFHHRLLGIAEPYITIAGQSAPGDGICLRGYNLEIRTHDVVVRFLRSCSGESSGKEVDAISVGGNSRNVVLDHCSASWSVDEALSPSGGISDVKYSGASSARR
jgi:pectate lyase